MHLHLNLSSYLAPLQTSVFNDLHVSTKAYKLRKRACNAIVHIETAKF